MSGYLPAIGAKEIEPLELVDRVAANAVDRREGPEGLWQAIWRDDSGAEVWLHYQGEAPQTTTVVFRGQERVTGFLAGFSPPQDGPLNGLVLLTGVEPPLAEKLVLDLAEYGEAGAQLCAGRRVSVGVSALLTEGQLFRDRAAYLAACSRRGGEAPTATLRPVGLQPQGNSPSATLGGSIARVEERRNSLSGEPFLVLNVEWEGHTLELAANPADLQGEAAAPGAYLTGRVWLVGFDIQYATVAPADPAQFPLQPGTVAAFTGYNGYLQLLQVTHLDRLEAGGVIVHLRIFAELFDSIEALQSHADPREIAVAHVPVDGSAVLDSDLAPLGMAPLEGVDEEDYGRWSQAFAAGQAPVFGLTLDQIVHWLAAQAEAAGQAAGQESMNTT